MDWYALPTFEQKRFISGQQAAQRFTNFFVRLLLATVIATFGVISDSTATVSVAMIGPITAPRSWPRPRPW